MQDPREPHDIAQQIIDDDQETMDELLKDTEVEDLDIEDFEDDFVDDEPMEGEIDYF